jgi:N-methylhydantoinase A
MKFKIGIDVGGTFTDLFLWSDAGTVRTFKTLSTPEDPSIGFMNGLQQIAESFEITMGQLVSKITNIVHGTTVTTNATLTHGGAKTGLLTTKGVRDALEMRRGIRERQYDNHYQNVEPLVPRYLRCAIDERVDAQGQVVRPLVESDVREALDLFGKEGVEAVAICFMNSYRNAEHEERVASIVRDEMPDAYLSVSSTALPTVRFYNRISTTTLGAYVGPILSNYLESLTGKLTKLGFAGVLLIMQSNGGVALPEVVREHAATTLLSGPAAGPCAAAAYTRVHGTEDCIVVDMGGTSFDASLVRGGQAAMQNEGDIERLRIALPMLAITTIGAGGGSIGWTDEGGLLRMGPQSAGAAPGPACYAKGGTLPTCTDANVVLGYLDPESFGGGFALDADKARSAIQEHIATPLGLTLEEAASGMYRVINNNMAHGVREITIKVGLDPREFPLVVAGGAGSLHACMIAKELDMPTLLVPSTASVLCATGMLLSDLRHDFVRSFVSPLSEIDLCALRGMIHEMQTEGARQLDREGMQASQMEHEVLFDLRYIKQYHEVTVAVPEEVIESGRLEEAAGLFHAEHDRLYGYQLAEAGTELELINVRLRSIGRTSKPPLPEVAQGGESPEAALQGQRVAYSPEDANFTSMPIYDGHALLAGNRITGPALIERFDTTIFVSRSFEAIMDNRGSCLLRAKGAKV